MAKAFNFVAWVDKNVRCAVHTVVPKLDAPSSFVKGARAAKKSRFTSLKTVAEELDATELLEATATDEEDCSLLEETAEELEMAELLDATDEEDFALLLEDSAEELDSAELLDATDEEDFALLLEDLALELLTAERSSGILVIQWLSMSLQSDWRRDSIMERFE